MLHFSKNCWLGLLFGSTDAVPEHLKSLIVLKPSLEPIGMMQNSSQLYLLFISIPRRR